MAANRWGSTCSSVSGECNDLSESDATALAVERRAGLLGGPDAWETVMWLEDLAAEADPIAALVEDSILTRSQVDAALRYRAAYPDQIAARIELHRRETDAAEPP